MMIDEQKRQKRFDKYFKKYSEKLYLKILEFSPEWLELGNVRKFVIRGKVGTRFKCFAWFDDVELLRAVLKDIQTKFNIEVKENIIDYDQNIDWRYTIERHKAYMDSAVRKKFKGITESFIPEITNEAILYFYSKYSKFFNPYRFWKTTMNGTKVITLQDKMDNWFTYIFRQGLSKSFLIATNHNKIKGRKFNTKESYSSHGTLESVFNNKNHSCSFISTSDSNDTLELDDNYVFAATQKFHSTIERIEAVSFTQDFMEYIEQNCTNDNKKSRIQNYLLTGETKYNEKSKIINEIKEIYKEFVML